MECRDWGLAAHTLPAGIIDISAVAASEGKSSRVLVDWVRALKARETAGRRWLSAGIPAQAYKAPGEPVASVARGIDASPSARARLAQFKYGTHVVRCL